MCYEGEVNLTDHDPKKINSHMKVQFLDIIAEPKGSHSINCVWQASECCYQFCFSTCYGLAVAFNCLWTAAYWGYAFGFVSFVHIWCSTPFFKWLGYVVHVPAACWRLCTHFMLDPCCEACSYMFMFFHRPPERPDEDWMTMAIY